MTNSITSIEYSGRWSTARHQSDQHNLSLHKDNTQAPLAPPAPPAQLVWGSQLMTIFSQVSTKELNQRRKRPTWANTPTLATAQLRPTNRHMGCIWADRAATPHLATTRLRHMNRHMGCMLWRSTTISAPPSPRWTVCPLHSWPGGKSFYYRFLQPLSLVRFPLHS